MTSRLPSNPSLKQLRHQAKDLLKAHGNGDASCCRVLRHLRQFTDKSDEDILSASVSLVQVQFALAMEYGFKNWDELKGHMPDDREIARMSRADWTAAITTMVENFWAGYNDGDYEQCSKDWSAGIRAQVDHANFATQRRNTLSWMGKFKSGELIIQNEDNYSVVSVWHIYGTKPSEPAVFLCAVKHIENELKFISTQICFPETKSLEPDGWRHRIAPGAGIFAL